MPLVPGPNAEAPSLCIKKLYIYMHILLCIFRTMFINMIGCVTIWFPVSLGVTSEVYYDTIGILEVWYHSVGTVVVEAPSVRGDVCRYTYMFTY